MSDPSGPVPPDPNPLDGDPPVDPDTDPEPADEGHHGLLDRLRHSGVGVEDPNIVGDVGPTDVPPGSDPETDLDGLVVMNPRPEDIPTEAEVPD